MEIFGDYVKGGLPYTSLGSFLLKKDIYLAAPYFNCGIFAYIFLVVVCEI